MKRIIALAISAAIIGVILASVDRAQLWANLKATRALEFSVALFLFIPQNAVMAYRWKRMASHFSPIGWPASIGMILAGQTMNIVLPSKMGDLTKAYFLKKTGAMDLPRATNLVVFEKMLDLGSLCFLALLGVVACFALGLQVENTGRFAALALFTGLLSGAVLTIILSLYFIPTDRIPFYQSLLNFLSGRSGALGKVHRLFESSHEVMAMLQSRHARRDLLAGLSVGLWVLHLVQIYFFFLSLNAPVPWLDFCALMPLAIFIGLLPISLFGLGTRDAAMIFLFAPYHPAAVIAGAGFYVSLRYFIPAAAGLPFLQHYLSLNREAQGASESKSAS